MIKKSLLLVAVLALCATANAGTRRLMNVNSSMELGPIDYNVPGYSARAWLQPKSVFDNPGRNTFPITVNDPERGRCLKVTGLKGQRNLQLNVKRYWIREGEDVEISFYAKIGPDENGKIHPVNDYYYAVDFRAMGGELSTKTYPVIKEKSFTPSQKWQKFFFKFKVIKGFPYYTFILNRPRRKSDAFNSLYIDDFKICLGNPADKVKYTEEAVITPDKKFPVYFKDQDVKLKVRALLDKSANTVDTTVVFRDNNHNQLYKKIPVKLTKSGKASSETGLTIYTGELEIKADRFGSFSGTLECDGNKAAMTASRFVVVHPVVNHKPFSPGWGIGANFQPVNLRGSEILSYLRAPYQQMLDEMRIGGITLIRYWGEWRLVEPERGKFTAEFMEKSLKGLRDKGFCIDLQLGCYMAVESEKQISGKAYGRMPGWTYKAYATQSRKNMKTVLPPKEIWERYVKYMVDNFGKYVDGTGIWEIINEPCCFLSPKDYLRLLREASAVIRNKYPKSIILGNGVTCDFGLNASNWCSDLLKEDPNYEDYIDGIAFHPYYASLDYDKGVFGKYSRLIDTIKKLRNKKTPIWNTECYYLPSSNKDQAPETYIEKSTFGGGDFQRHYLLNYLNGVKGVIAIINGSFYQYRFSDLLAGGNALSWFLKDMDKLKRLDTKINRLLRIGVYSSKDGKKGLGFIWDLRPTAARWTVPAQYLKSLEFYDLFGNKMDMSKGAELSLDPIFVKGNPKTIADMFHKSEYRPAVLFELTGRIFNDTIVVEANNNSGTDCYFEAAFKANESISFPERIMFQFMGNTVSSVTLDNAVVKKPQAGCKLEWDAYLDGTKSGSAKMTILPDTGSHILPSKGKQPLELKVGENAVARFTADSAGLNIEVNVKDEKIVQSKDKNFYTADAVEVFIDANPFYHLAQPLVNGAERMNVYQYFLAATPAKDGSKFWATHYRKGDFKTEAVYKNEATTDGYKVSVSITWKEIKPWFYPDGVMGIDIEISDKDDVNKPKQSLGKKPGKSFVERLHYPLFKLPPEAVKFYRDNALEIFGGEFVKNESLNAPRTGRSKQMPGWKGRGSRLKMAKWTGLPEFYKLAPEGYLNTDGVFVDNTEKELQWLIARKRKARIGINQNINLKKGRHHKLVVQAMIKMDNLKVYQPGLETMRMQWDPPGAVVSLHYYPSRKNCHFRQGRELTGTTGWRLMQFVADIVEGSDKFALFAGFIHPVTGKIWLDNVKIKYLDK